ncbi:hypothetical protein LguiA_015056 [Lonicera macranthoides]
MIAIKPCEFNISQSPFLHSHYLNQIRTKIETQTHIAVPGKSGHRRGRKLVVLKANANGEAGKSSERRSFLTIEEAGIVEMSGLSTHERFLCRLTISSLNLLRVVAEQEGCSIEELNAGRVSDWFLKDKLKREQNLDSAVLQWDESDFQL